MQKPQYHPARSNTKYMTLIMHTKNRWQRQRYVTDHGIRGFVADPANFISVHRVPQMQGGGRAVVLPVLQTPANTADVVPCERLTAGLTQLADSIGHLPA